MIAETCLQPVSVGRCHSPSQRWYFNSALGRCTEFTYSGCGFNANHFFTRRQCVENCDGIKLFPKGIRHVRPTVLVKTHYYS